MTSSPSATASSFGELPAYRRTVEDVATTLGTDVREGLTRTEVTARQDRYGSNELASVPETPAWRRFVAQFDDTMVQLLLAATVMSAGIWFVERDAALPYDAIVILAIVLVNAVLGFVQEERAARAVAALKELTATHATVVRDGERRDVPAADLVPGDVLVLAEGDAVTADARLVEVAELRTIEGALTGESLPAHKHTESLPEDAVIGDRVNCVFAGTSIASGRGRAVVTETGMATEVGRIAGMLERTEPTETPLQRELDRVGRRLGQLVIAIAVVVAVTVLATQSAALHDLRTVSEVLLLAVALAVAAVPEGLPAVVTSTLAIGVQRIARRNAIVRKLPAVETLGSATCIASDKTGTLTRNEMTVRVVVTASGRTELGGSGWDPAGDVTLDPDADAAALRSELERALTVAARCNDAELTRANGGWKVLGDPTEAALLVAAVKIGLSLNDLEEDLPRLAEVPFSSERKRMATAHREDDRTVLFVKGATDLLLERCDRELVAGPDGGLSARPLDDAARGRIVADNETLTGRALRTLGVAVRDLGSATAEPRIGDETGLSFIGIVGMLDPPREAAAPAVARAREAGIRPLLITGDHPATAVAIAAEIGIARPDATVLTGRDLEHLDDDSLEEQVARVNVFARVDPAHKLRLVEALQRRGDVVAMTGDGVNDAPALQSADIGVAMGIAGTDVSKEAADMILLDDDFATIVAAVEEGRGIFTNIRKFLRYLLTSNAGEVMTMFFGVVLAGLLGLVAAGGDSTVVLPLLATQILWINLVTDGLPALALGLDPVDPDAMQRPPRPPGEGVLTRRMWIDIVRLGAVMAVGTLAVLDGALPGGLVDFTGGTGTLAGARTMTFTTLVLFQLFNTFICRTGDHTIVRGLFRNRLLWAAVAISFALQVAVVHLAPLQRAFSTTGMSPARWGVAIAVASSVVWVDEIRMWILRWRAARTPAVDTSSGQG